ncbi:PTS N-acetylgalactosamine transporter subunit IIC [Pseudostreptobacillus hongkongensis]|uniref:PTS N-acetylgalactosamine transporter subunit IIC n=1 Tax=Pseudostreptobacillus hongkongensis TaxID=1162717 RepID=UPI00082F6499|nr:PTS N-acetylgalactosamine transporter subunit IIC [Pseudostreptobacillus hongkongensis]
MLLQALLIALWAGFCGIEQFDFLETMHRPIVSGLVIGLILGDLQTGLVTGGMLELMYMGLMPLAGAQPPNVVIGAVVGISLAILSKGSLNPEAASALSYPFALLAQIMVTLMFTVFSPLMHKADEMAEKLDIRGLEILNLSQLVVRFILWGGISFLVVYFGADKLAGIVNAFPAKLIDGFKVAGGMMPAVGFGILLNIMLKKDYIPFLIVGFIFSAYLHLDTLAVALLGVSIAMYDLYILGSKPVVEKEENYDDGI